MANNERGEFTIKVADLEITICPSYGRQARATGAVGGRSVQALLFALGGDGIGIVEQANYLEQLSNPRIKANDIGEALAKAGALRSSEVFGDVITKLAKGSEEDGNPPVEDNDEGK